MILKRIVFVIGMLFIWSSACVAVPITGQPEFTAWSDFEGMFGKIYNDTGKLDAKVICERVLQWPDFLDEEEELLFSIQDCEEFAETETLSSFVNTHTASKTRGDRWIEVFLSKYKYEKQVWKDEYNWQRKMALSSIWKDGDGGGKSPAKSNSPVDLVVRWNEIDTVLFGIMAEYPEIKSFTESEEKIIDSWAETPEEDEQLDQRPEKKLVFGYLKNHYEDGELSIAGGYHEKAKMFETLLNPYSLIPGYATMQTFDMAFTGAPAPTSTGMHVDTAASPAESPDEPEQLAVLKQKPMGELEGVFSTLFRQQSNAELRNAKYDGSRTSELNETFVLESKAMQKMFSEHISSLLRTRSETRAKDAELDELFVLQQFNTALTVWIKILDKWEKVNDAFLSDTRKE